MTDRPRYYLTTAIAYANNRPGPAHPVRGDRRRRHRALAPDEGRRHALPDRHRRALDQHRPERPSTRAARPREFVDEKVGYFQDGRGRPARSRPTGSSGRPIPDHVRAAQEMVRRAHANGDIYLGTYEGWYCPNEGFRNATDVAGDRARHDLPEPSRRAAPVADREELVLPAVGLPGAPRAPLRRPPRLRPARLPAQRDARLHPRRPRGLLDLARADARRLGHPVPDRRERRDRAARGRLVGSRGRRHLRLVRRAHQLHHRRRLPGRPRRVRALVAGRPARHRQGHRPVPHDLLAGDAVERRARGAPPRVGPRLDDRAGREDEQEPRQLPRSDRLRGRVRRGRRALRHAARGAVRPRRRGVVGLVRPALQRRPGQRLRQPRSTAPCR